MRRARRRACICARLAPTRCMTPMIKSPHPRNARPPSAHHATVHSSTRTTTRMDFHARLHRAPRYAFLHNLHATHHTQCTRTSNTMHPLSSFPLPPSPFPIPPSSFSLINRYMINFLVLMPIDIDWDFIGEREGCTTTSIDSKARCIPIVDLIKKSKTIVALTGAGISTRRWKQQA
jgi:hypothetical protein